MSSLPISPATQAFLDGPHLLLIDGRWVEGEGRLIQVENPAREEVIAEIKAASLAQLDQAVAAARKAFKGEWGRKTSLERSALLLRFADLIERDADLIGEIMATDMGQDIKSSRYLARHLSATLFRYYAGWTDKIVGDAFQPMVGLGESDYLATTLMEPIGVVGAIIPWNAPPGMLGLKLAPSLAAGCSVVLKSAEVAPLVASHYARLWVEAGGPPGSLNLLHGYGDDIGAGMASHPDIDKITFTGSTGVGKSIAAASSGNLKRVTLELGGKSPFIVFPDVDVEQVAQMAAVWAFVASGQACVAASRTFVHDDIYEPFVEAFCRIARNLRVGDGLEEETDCGPLVSKRQKERVLDYIKSGVEEGAPMLVGSEPVPNRGHFVRPTVFGDVQPHMRIAREEIFGPVASLFRFSDEAAMLEIVNDTPFGLSGSVWTKDLERAMRVARGIDAGQIGINVHAAMSAETPFGGNKQSGWGREFGKKGIEAFLKVKAITMRLGDRTL